MTPAPEDVAMAALRALVAAVVREEMARRQPTADAPPRLLSIAEVAAATNLGRMSVYALLNRGELRSVKVGRRRLVSAAALADYIASRDAEL